MLRDCVDKYYFDGNYNCAESVLRAANEYYGLDLHDRDMILVSGFGAGVQTGDLCGAFLSAVSVLSFRYVERRAHESPDLMPVVTRLTERFREKMQGSRCTEIRPRVFVEGRRCAATVYAACDAVEEILAEWGEDRNCR